MTIFKQSWSLANRVLWTPFETIPKFSQNHPNHPPNRRITSTPCEACVPNRISPTFYVPKSMQRAANQEPMMNGSGGASASQPKTRKHDKQNRVAMATLHQITQMSLDILLAKSGKLKSFEPHVKSANPSCLFMPVLTQ